MMQPAADAMADSDERRLTVKTETEADRVVVLVQDTGPGIKTPDKVFDPFYTTKGVGGKVANAAIEFHRVSRYSSGSEKDGEVVRGSSARHQCRTRISENNYRL